MRTSGFLTFSLLFVLAGCEVNLQVPNGQVAVARNRSGDVVVYGEGKHPIESVKKMPRVLVTPRSTHDLKFRMFFVPGLLDSWQQSMKDSVVFNLIPAVGEQVRKAKVKTIMVNAKVIYTLPDKEEIDRPFRFGGTLSHEDGVMALCHRALEELGGKTEKVTKDRKAFGLLRRSQEDKREIKDILEEVVKKRLEKDLCLKNVEVTLSDFEVAELNSAEVRFEKTSSSHVTGSK